MAADLPEKLVNDAIAEALLEIRFNSSELNEVVVGRLSDVPAWSPFKSTRLAVSHLPEVVRENDQSLQYTPIIEKQDTSRNFSVRIGGHVLSLHFHAPYPGWDVFSQEISNAVTELFQRLPDVVVSRLGLRYINLLQSGVHKIDKFSDLELNVSINANALEEKLNLAFVEQPNETTIVQTRIASPDFIGGANMPADITAAIDVDVYTKKEFTSKSAEEVIEWIDLAHQSEKEYFFQLLPENIIKELTE